MKYKSSSEDETKQIAENFAENLVSNVIALTGQLGAGKTTFTQGFAKGLGIKDKIISPSFVLIRQHKIPNSKGIFYHVDLYRLENNKDLENLGLQEFWSDKNNIVLIEWAEKLRKLPKKVIKINIKSSGNQNRVITVS